EHLCSPATCMLGSNNSPQSSQKLGAARGAMMLDPRAVARALGGAVTGRNILAPGPGHSRADRSLSITINPAARDGFIVHSFAGDLPIACRDHVRAALGLGARERGRKEPMPWRPGPRAVAPT